MPGFSEIKEKERRLKLAADTQKRVHAHKHVIHASRFEHGLNGKLALLTAYSHKNSRIELSLDQLSNKTQTHPIL